MPAGTGVDTFIVVTREPTLGDAKKQPSISPEATTGCPIFHHQESATAFPIDRAIRGRLSTLDLRLSEEHFHVLIVSDSSSCAIPPESVLNTFLVLRTNRNQL